jgi:hypothetical protein
MPFGARVDTNGLKLSVMLFSGELSMTTSPVGVPEPDDAGALPPDEAGAEPVVLELDEQAARPAARSPVAVSASALLLILEIVNFDLSSRG